MDNQWLADLEEGRNAREEDLVDANDLVYKKPLLVSVWSADVANRLGRVGWFGDLLNNGEPPTKYQDKRPIRLRIRHWWRDHKPVFHLGECDHDDCYYADESPVRPR